MDRFKKVLVAMAPGRMDRISIQRTAELVNANRASVTLVDVIEPLPSWRRVVNVEGRDFDIEEMLLSAREDDLRRVAEMLGPVDVEIEVVVEMGKPFVEIIRRVAAEGFDLVVVGEPAPERGRTKGLGAGVMQLLRKCPVPVWVMRPCGEGTMRILALVDPDPSDPVRDGLNDVVLELAVGMARRRRAELHVAHAWQLPGAATLASSPFLAIPAIEFEMIMRAAAIEHRDRMTALVERHGISDVGGQVHLVPGEPGQILPDLAERLDIDLIVMGTVARTGLSGLIMGNTAETVLRSVGCSVLAVKPVGFVSPVLG